MQNKVLIIKFKSMAKFKVYYKSEEFIIEADKIIWYGEGLILLEDDGGNIVAVLPPGSAVCKLDAITKQNENPDMKIWVF